ncbi:mechanosensitive ion channel family protein [Cohnella sp. REN36]|uniref:mechanosensitive ion channel family protein n=1 Tax=Cohnella sp. REN36 TaxID=2887347 RepID=UPI001D1530D2|nr:mechanosensitive ion channel domain-containing protein [Cohnella sp. REN36]MCC3373813.1 mechanosensitive ion channel family protein [Cohnella sp. REN36]
MDYLKDLLADLGMKADAASFTASAILIVGIVALSILGNFATKKVVLKIVTRYIRSNRFRWNQFILERKVVQKLSHIVPVLILYYFSFSFPSYQLWIEKGVVIYLIVVTLGVLDALLSAANDIYTTFEISKSRPIRGYIQVVKIFVFLIGGILVISRLIGESPLILLSGIGALSAVMMLIFKDSLLGLVAGIQLASNDMVRVGDWIEMPKYGADGDVIDLSLNTVKVQNWDKTITTLPTYALISDSFKNWRGMQNAGGRRIKRSIYIDMSSIGFCSPEQIRAFKKIEYVRDYLIEKEEEIDRHNEERAVDRSSLVNGRAMTNIGVFRAYVQRYLEHHPMIHQGMTRMVRQLAPGEMGLPVEIYAFTNVTVWAVYEGVQSDIFDHILAIAPAFGLRVFQSPSGHDMQRMMHADAAAR